LTSREFTLEDLRDQLRQLRRLGPLAQVMEMLPRVGPLKGLAAANVDERQLRRIEAIISSMTPQERRLPHLLNGSRKRRIARGSGTAVEDVNRLLKQYKGMRKMWKGVAGSFLRRALGGT
jgi:signal recognition particle subunit SRP54